MGSTDNDSSYTVVSSSFGAGNTTITVSESPQSNTVDGTIYDCPSSYNCIFEMAASAYIEIKAKLAKFSGICLKGHATAGNGLVVTNQAQVLASSNLVIRDCDTGLIVQYQSSFTGTTPVLHNCDTDGLYMSETSVATISEGMQACNCGGKGVQVTTGSLLTVDITGSGDTHQHLVCSNNTSQGAYIESSSSVTGTYGQFINNGSHGIWVRYNSLFIGDYSNAKNNTSIGFYAHVGSTMRIPNATAYYNGSDGVKAYLSSLIDFSSGTSDNNTGHGIYAQDGAVISAGAATSTNNNTGVYANSGAHILFQSGTSSSNSTNYSPAGDTVGNANSYIDT
jgi:hypothetical protein